jgi:Kef-type K+ transport system membrane component KefB
MLFVWTAGVQLVLLEAWEHRRDTGVTAGLALFVPLSLGVLVTIALGRSITWLEPQGTGWQSVLGIGMASAVTALRILVLFLEQLNILHAPIGRRILRYASLDDVAIWAVLGVILVDWHRAGRQEDKLRSSSASLGLASLSVE